MSGKVEYIKTQINSDAASIKNLLQELDHGVQNPTDLELDKCTEDLKKAEEHEQRVEEILKRMKSKTDALTEVKEKIVLQEAEAQSLRQQIENEKKNQSIIITLKKLKDFQQELEKEILVIHSLITEILESFEQQSSETSRVSDSCQRLRKQCQYFFWNVPVIKTLPNLSTNMRETTEIIDDIIHKAEKLGQEIVPTYLQLVEPIFQNQDHRRRIQSVQDKIQATQLLRQKSAKFLQMLAQAHQACVEMTESEITRSLSGICQISKHIASQDTSLQHLVNSRNQKSVKKQMRKGKALSSSTNKKPEFKFGVPSTVPNVRSDKVFKTPTHTVKPSTDSSLHSLDDLSRQTKTALKTYQIQQIQQTNLYINRRYTRQMNEAAQSNSRLK